MNIRNRIKTDIDTLLFDPDFCKKTIELLKKAEGRNKPILLQNRNENSFELVTLNKETQ